MLYTATITSKRQITIPSELYEKVKLSKGDKVMVQENNGNILLKPAIALIEDLAGSVKIPKHLKGIDTDKALRIAKEKYFGRRVK